MVGLLRRDEPEHAHRVSLSLAKKAAAFFKISRSCSQRPHLAAQPTQLLALLTRQPFTRAGVDLGLTRPDPQRLGRDPEVVRDLLSGRPARRYSSTASRRNSGGYGFGDSIPLA